ncbi:DNA ligase D [Pseudoxanthomonas wuyuanensis]|uniref:DNA ligase (ATP) n=1 Tax=Pseudoxanthomonas wuyuanensis TaxID=1073196 RepID=A0A286D5T8_9GAMM|nr:DNA ligase D [Pseudoxanthomonas wuyuanensis]KAF1719212.1 ATP-dependent DNA ligase [Pseudoxanthomonas wuyuanensis]SOD54022.1 ATP-dependent DNA ligase LigD phosphoesterase module /ATP-dependent DNA ligase LigD polymerase module [Pseudoxanthomonas wuyuanensis]
MSLQEYQRKRRFDRTPEPAPAARGARSRRPIFVVQLHHASHRHYDFRLQVGDTLKSWAVPKGPSFDPAVKRLAAEVEDHPLDYADFEGEIPKGQYGGGHVATFDRGLWTTDGDPEAQLAKGHLRFEMFGQKLRGGWHLVRTHKAARQPQWLLFKERDGYAGKQQADDLLQDVTPPPGQAPPRPARKAARKRASAHAAAGDRWARRAARLEHARAAHHRPAFRAPQLAKLYQHVPDGDDWLHEAKWDGYRLIAQIARGKVRLWSRNELEWTARAPEIVAALESLGLYDAVLDGELVAGAGRQEDFGLLQATLSGEKNATLSYVLFDVLQIDDVDLARSPQYQRKALLAEILKNPPAHLVYSSHIVGRGQEALAKAIERGLEGIICKRADAPYHAGRSDAWRKIKQRASDEFAVVGYTAPRGSRTGLGALLLAAPDTAHGWRYVGRVGTGFSNELLGSLAAKLSKSSRAKPTVFVGVDDPELRQARWVVPRLVAEVFYHGFGNQGLLRQPSLKTIRADKRATDLGDGDAPAPKESNMPATRGSKSDSAPVELTSPGRVVYPDSGISKAQVFDYYRTMARWLLPEIQGRPLSVVRCPQGAARPCFFQKHHTAGMDRVQAVALEEEGGTRADYLLVNDEAGLLELVQFNALEFHPWGARADTPDRADRIVFDLDPGPDVAWPQVVQAARLVRARLAALGLASYVRTSGGKGLHVVAPLKPTSPWAQAKAFAHAFAESMAASEPLAFVATAAKKFRKGRIFIDYLRNGRGATSVASFSLRARDGAPVAMPLRWAELGRIKGGNAYDLVSAQRRMARMKSHPWGDYARRRQDLEGVGRALAGQGKQKAGRAPRKR